MDSKDELIKGMIRDQAKVDTSFGGMFKQILEDQRRAFSAIRDMHYDLPRNIFESLKLEEMLKVGDTYRYMLEGLGASVNRQVAEAIRQTAIGPSFDLKSQTAQAIAAITKSISPTGMNAMAEAIANMKIDLPKLSGAFGIAGLAALKAGQYDLGKGFPADLYKGITPAFATQVAESLKEALKYSEQSAAQFARLEKLVEDRVATLPHDQVTAEGLWQVILNILLVLLALGQGAGLTYQIYDAKQTTKAQGVHRTQLMDVLQHIAANTQKLVPENDLNTYYVIERQVSITVKPNNRSSEIAILFPNQKVRLVQMNHQWIYVEYFDYLDGIPKYGWANKKYCKRLDKSM